MRVPQYEERRQIVQAVRPVGVEAAQPGVGGAAKGLAEVGAMFDQWQADVDEGRAKEADTLYAERVRKTLYADGTGYLYAQGGDAMARRKEAADALQRDYEDIVGGLSPAARRMADQAMTARRMSALTNIDQHAGRERITYLNGQSEARIKGAVDDAILDPGALGKSLAITRGEIADTGARLGWSPEEIASKQQDAEAGMHSGIVSRLANANPVQALEYLGAHRDKMAAGDVARLEGALIPEAKRYRGRQIGAQMAGGAGIGEAFQVARQFQGMNETAQRETLQQFLAEGGANIDPSKTAWCAAFVNATLARAGNGGTGSNLARSFLNWGQAVDQPEVGDVVVLERGKPPFGHVGFFAGFAPDGSIQILGGNQGGAAQGGGGVTVSTFPPERVLGYRRASGGGETAGPSPYNTADRMGEILAIEDPDVRSAALQEFNLVSGVAQARQKEVQDAAQRAAWALIESGGRVDDLPMEQRLTIGQEGMSTLRTYQEKVTRRESVETDPALYVELTRQAVEDPAAFAARDPMEWRLRLNDTDFKAFVQKQAERPEGETGARALTVSRINSVTENLFKAAGFDTKKEKGQKSLDTFHAAMFKWAASTDGTLTDDQIITQARAMLTQVAIDPPGPFNRQEAIGFEATSGIDASAVTLDDFRNGAMTIGDKTVSKASVERFIKDHKEKTGFDPEPADIVEFFAEGGYGNE